MKYISFNINGLRARIHQLEAIITKHNPDIIGLQETKVHDDMFPLQTIRKLGYHVFYYGQKSHYGVALLTRVLPIKVQRGFPNENEKAQRRLIIAEIPAFLGKITIINGYFPQGDNRNHPTKFLAKEKFYLDLRRYLEDYLREDDFIIVMGDMNISNTDLDIGISKENQKRWLRTGKCSFLPEERKWMAHLLDWGLVDIWRADNPNCSNRFSWFDYRSKGFNNNSGLRIDLLLATHIMANKCISTGIDYNIRSMKKPSDHAPVWAEFSL